MSNYDFKVVTTHNTNSSLMWLLEDCIVKNKMTWTDAVYKIQRLCTENKADYSDWRLPTKEELMVMINYVLNGNKEDIEMDKLLGWLHFNRTCIYKPDWFWSSSEYRALPEHYNKDYVYCINILSGEDEPQNKYYYKCLVLPVRIS